MSKVWKNPRSGGRSLAYLDDSDYYDALQDDTYYADEYEEGDFYEDDDYEEYKPKRTPLTVNLLSAQPGRASTKKSRCSVAMKNAESEEKADPLAYLATMKPRLVRSKSFTSERPQTRTSHRRSSSLTVLRAIVTDATAHPTHAASVQCIQSLIPARASVVGPMPRASLTIISSKCRAAVLLTWSFLRPEPRVLPLVGCSKQIADNIQSELRGHLAPHQEAGWKAYWNMSTTLYERRDEWVTLLEDNTPNGPTQAHQRLKYLSQGCTKATMTLGQCYSHYEMLENFEDKLKAPLEQTTPQKVGSNHVCLVCFEGMEADAACQLLACGHATCMDCSKAYLTSAAAAGHGSIKCSAYKCDVSVNVFDAAHILNEETDNETWERLVRFALERSETPPGARVCSARNCGRLVNPTLAESSEHPGFNMLMCDCGTSRCRDCKHEGHPGVTCSEYKILRRSIDSGKLDAELANVKWVIKNSRPCPKCQYPIEKNGGCNHVRCQQCEHYFCFQCGGEGQLCMAFMCKNTNKYWHEDPDYNEGHYTALNNLVDKYRAYRSTRRRLSCLVDSLTDCNQEYINNKPEVLLEIQCLQALLWLHVSSISRMMSNHEANFDQGNAVLSLDLVLHVLSLRKLEQQTKIKPSQETLANPPGLPPSRRLSHCKQIAKERQQLVGGKRGSFQEIFVDQELQNLLRMDTAGFAKNARDAIQQGVQALCLRTKKPNNRRRSKKHPAVEGPLNQKMKRPNDPWRNGYCVNSNEEDWSDDGNRSMKRSDRWKKSKSLVKARRNAILGLNGL